MLTGHKFGFTAYAIKVVPLKLGKANKSYFTMIRSKIKIKKTKTFQTLKPLIRKYCHLS